MDTALNMVLDDPLEDHIGFTHNHTFMSVDEHIFANKHIFS